LLKQHADNKPPTRPLEVRKHVEKGRDRVSNGVALFLDGDLRSKAARRFKGIISALTADSGGPERLGEARKQIIRRAAMLATSCETMEAASLVDGKGVDLDLYSRMTNTLRRLLETLGLDRVPKDVESPSLEVYMAETYGPEPEPSRSSETASNADSNP
jgi:hypothetical protein